MKKTRLHTVLPVALFSLFVALVTLITMLDAFVFDRALGEGPISRDPNATFAPVGDLFPESTKSTTTEPQVSSSTPVTGGSPADTTSSPAFSTETPDSSSVPDSEVTPDPQYPIIGDLYYKDENIEITIEENTVINQHGVETKYFAVDLKLSDIEYLRTAFNLDEDNKVVRATTSELAEENNAIFAINGDYFSFRERGFVLRNYILYREKPRKADEGDDALLLMNDGMMYMIHENEIPAKAIPLSAYQCFSFGPRLLENGVITVDGHSEVGQSQASNPRTAIGMIEPLHYKIVVSEGRLVEDDGLTLLELAQIMDGLGCTAAYNLDGGSSTTLYFNGKVLNELSASERKISDIIYINGKSYSEEN